MKESIKSAARCGVPLVCIHSNDEPATVTQLADILQNRPLIQYDCVRGFVSINPDGQKSLSSILGDSDPILFTDPTTAISAAMEKLPDNTVIICYGAHRYSIDNPTVQQAIANCRDAFKSTQRILVLLCPFGTTFPPELTADFYTIDDNPPDETERQQMITDLHEAAEIKAPENGTLNTAITATRGLSHYAAEQAVALSLTRDGLNTEQLWKRWRQGINSTPGLSVDMSGSTLNDIGGLSNIKDFASKVMSGRDKPQAVIRIEEIEKAMAGSGAAGSFGDSSGTSQGMLQAILTFMQEENQTGFIAVGPPGSGKSLASVAIGSAGNVPTITLDLGTLKGSLVGQTEANTRKALSTIKALAGENALWVATCNSLAALPPELKRRFQYGIWYFDLPDNTERAAIWKIWLSKYPDVEDIRPDDNGWTGAEIRTAVQIAYRLKITPKEAAQWVVPVSKMSAENIEALRKQASGRYLSASKKGVFTYQSQAAAPTATTRKIDLGD